MNALRQLDGTRVPVAAELVADAYSADAAGVNQISRTSHLLRLNAYVQYVNKLLNIGLIIIPT